MAIEIVDFPINSMVDLSSSQNVSSPEGIPFFIINPLSNPAVFFFPFLFGTMIQAIHPMGRPPNDLTTLWMNQPFPPGAPVPGGSVWMPKDGKNRWL